MRLFKMLRSVMVSLVSCAWGYNSARIGLDLDRWDTLGSYITVLDLP